MASKVKLKWRRAKGEFRAGPFYIYESSTVPDLFRACIGPMRLCVGTEARAKAACERLAARILTATRARKRGRRK